MLNLQLLGDKILVEVEEETKNPSGLIVSVSKDQGEIKSGTVVSVGSGKMNDNGIVQPMKTLVGDKVLFQYGTKIVIEGKSYVLVTESGDVIGIQR